MPQFLSMLFFVPTIASVFFSLASAQQPDDPIATMHPAEGVEVSLWAGEPMVRNPTAIEVDSRGRVWIAEGLNYRMKQLPLETMKRIKDADQIKILEDTDGDGKADKVTVFADNIFPVPLGMAIEEIWTNGKQTGTRVYVGNSPDLLVLEDTDGDDKADRRFALLTGFRGIDSDHGLHGMTFGPDGKLYFSVGDARYGFDKVQARETTFDVTDKSNRRVSASNFGTTLRVNQDGTQLQVLSTGHRNNYEVAVDSFGNVFGSDNDDDGERGCRMYWVLPGGQYGYHHPGSSRHWAEEIPGIIPKLVGTGNGAPSGITVYEGGGLPGKYHGCVLQIDAGTHQVNVHPLHRHGAGFRSDYDVLLKGDDDQFRPVDLAAAPDGSVFVCDWHDLGVGANRFSDQTTGRIYRLGASSGDGDAIVFDGTNAANALRSPNAPTRLAARQSLVMSGAGARESMLKLLENGRPFERARALHVLRDLPETGSTDAIASLGNSDPRLRESALQLLAGDLDREIMEGRDAAKVLGQLLPLAEDDDAGVRRALLFALRDIPADHSLSSEVCAAIGTLAYSWDGQDRFYLEGIRAATLPRGPGFIRQLCDDLADQAIENGWNDEPIASPPYYPVGTNDAFLRPDDHLPPSNAASRVAGIAWVLQSAEALPAITRILERNRSASVETAATIALAQIEDPAAGQLLMQRFLSPSIEIDSKQRIVRQLGNGLADPWEALANDETLKSVFTTALQNPALQRDSVGAIARGRLAGFADPLLRLAQDETADVQVRASAIAALGKLKHAPVRALAMQLVDTAKGHRSGGPLALAALDAIYALAKDDSSAAPFADVLVNMELPVDVRRRSLQLATGSEDGVSQVLAIREKNAFPKDLENELSFLLHNHPNNNVRYQAKQVFPVEPGKDGMKIHNVPSILALQGDAARGRELFVNHKDAACARCHHVTGKGALVGPDLASIGLKYGGKELLYHIQFPSGAINYGFVSRNFLMDDGRLISGLVIDRKDGQITLGIATGEHIMIDADAVDEERPQTVSIMPAGLVSGLTEQELSDLVEYLLTLRQGDAIRTK